MEPTTKKTKIIVMVVLLVIVFAIFVILIPRVKAPVDTNTTGSQTILNQTESKQLSSDIDSATDINNEASLSDIDKEFAK